MRYILATLVAMSVALSGRVAEAAPASHDGARTSSSEQSQPESKADVQPAFPVAVQNSIERIARALEAQNNEQASATDEDRAQRNLEAQERMARSSAWMFWIMLGETLLTGAGVFLVWRTLKAAWASKDEAKRAADETKRAADVAEKELAAIMPRPHLIVTRIQMGNAFYLDDRGEPEIPFGFIIENKGSELAFVKLIWMVMTPTWKGFHPLVITHWEPDDIPDEAERLNWPIPPGGALVRDMESGLSNFQFAQSLRAEIVNGKKIMLAIGTIQYVGLSGTKYEHWFAYRRQDDGKFVPFEEERYWKYT